MLCTLQPLEMRIEIPKLLRENISIGYEVKIVLPVPFLHAHNILTQFVFSRDLVGAGEVVDFLVFIETLVEVRLAGAVAPEQVPIVRLSGEEGIRLQDRTHQAGVTAEELVEELGGGGVGVNVAGVGLRGRIITQQLILPYGSELNIRRGRNNSSTSPFLPIEVSPAPTPSKHQTLPANLITCLLILALIFNILEPHDNLHYEPKPFLILYLLPTGLGHTPLFVAHIGCTRFAAIQCAYALPAALDVGLDVHEAVQRCLLHVSRALLLLLLWDEGLRCELGLSGFLVGSREK